MARPCRRAAHNHTFGLLRVPTISACGQGPPPIILRLPLPIEDGMNPHHTMASPRPTVAVVDGDANVRRSLHELIEAAGWQASTFATAQEFLMQPGSPSCVLLDVKLPDSCGLDLQARLANRPGTPVIFITQHCDISLTVRAMKAGAVDFLMKPVCHEAVSTAIAHAIVLSNRNSALRNRYASLSAREREVLKLVVGGLLNKQVSGELGISEVTVKVHRGRIMRKMAAASLAHLVRMAGDLGLQSARVLSPPRAGPVTRLVTRYGRGWLEPDIVSDLA